MATAGVYNFSTLKRGDAFKGKRFKMYSDAEHTVPLSITGYSILMQVRKSKFDPVVLEWSTADGTITIENGNEFFLAKKTKVDMDIDPFEYLYDIEFTDGDDEPETFIEGVFPISNDISKKWT